MNKSKFLPNFINKCMTIGELPTSYKISLTYEEQLMWFCRFLEEQVIPVVNNNSEVVEELKAFVTNYFDNLDVQEEIDTKLDAMVEDGTFDEIINQTLFTELDNKVTQNTNDIETLSTQVGTNTTDISNIKNTINTEKITKLRKYYSNNYDYVNIPGSFKTDFFNKFLPFTNDGRNYIPKNYDVSDLKNTGSSKYYVSPNGNDSNDGLTEATPKYSWASVMSLINDGGTIIFAPGVYNRGQGLGNSYRARSVNMICEKGEAILTLADNLTWSQYQTTNVYSASRTNVINVIDISNIKNGNVIFLQKVSNLNDCIDTENTYYYDNSTIYVHMKFNQVPTINNLICPLHIGAPVLAIKELTENAKIYCENISFVGGDDGNVLVRSNSSYTPTFIGKNCKFLASNYNTDQYDNFSSQGGKSIMQNCMASYGKKDGFNYHSYGAKSPEAIEINCKASYNGHNAPSATQDTNNGSTIHDGGKIIRYNGTYNNNFGANVADVSNNTISLNFGVNCFDSEGDANNIDFLTGQGTTQMYLYNCYTKNSDSETNLKAEDTSTIIYTTTEYDTSSGNVVPR